MSAHKNQSDISINSTEWKKSLPLGSDNEFTFRVISSATPDLEKFLANNMPLVENHIRFFMKGLAETGHNKELRIIQESTGYNSTSDNFDHTKFDQFIIGKSRKDVSSSTKDSAVKRVNFSFLEAIQNRGFCFLSVEKDNKIVGMLNGVLHRSKNLDKNNTRFNLLNFYAPGYEEVILQGGQQWIKSAEIPHVLFGSILKSRHILENKDAVKSLSKLDSMLNNAASGRNMEAFKALLEYLPIETKDSAGYTPFHLMACNCTEKDIPFLKELLDLGANFNNHSEGFFDNTPIHTNIANEKFNSAILLIKLAKEYGFSLDTIDEQNKTPLHLAAMVGAPDVVMSLIENGAKLNERDHLGRTPIHYAALRGNIDVFNNLLNADVQTNIKDKDGNLPLDLSLPKNNPMLEEMLSDIAIKPESLADSVGMFGKKRETSKTSTKETVWEAAIKGREAITNKLNNLDTENKWRMKITTEKALSLATRNFM